MFRESLSEKLKKIFQIKAVSFDQPSEAKEQQVIFVSVESAISQVTKGRAVVRVSGGFSVFVNSDKLPFGYFNKRIEQASFEDTADLFFYNIDQNQKYFGNLVERRVSFIYFYDSQYDPAAGEISSINFT